jgi:hypothetical protein
MVAKMQAWNASYITMVEWTSLVKSILASQSIYHLTTLVVPPDTTHAMKKIERAFLWEATDKASRGQCMVNWDTVCRPENLGGLGIRNNDHFA